MTNKKDDPSSPDIKELLTELRKLAPVRAMRYSEHLSLAERQVTRLHQLLGQRGPAASLVWLTDAPSVSVILQPRWKMNGLSGLTTWQQGQWIIGINKGNSHTRRRFTLMHEFKHLLDAPRDRITYRTVNEDQRELIANYFAACYLMPQAWVSRAWTRGLQDPEALAGLFNVSTEAMEKRLNFLGFVDNDPERSVSSYFRREAVTTERAA